MFDPEEFVARFRSLRTEGDKRDLLLSLTGDQECEVEAHLVWERKMKALEIRRERLSRAITASDPSRPTPLNNPAEKSRSASGSVPYNYEWHEATRRLEAAEAAAAIQARYEAEEAEARNPRLKPSGNDRPA